MLHHPTFGVSFLVPGPEEFFIVQVLGFSSLRPMRSSASCRFCGSPEHVAPEESFMVQLSVFSSLRDPGGVRHRAAFGVVFTLFPLRSSSSSNIWCFSLVAGPEFFTVQLFLFSSLRPLRTCSSCSFWCFLHRGPFWHLRCLQPERQISCMKCEEAHSSVFSLPSAHVI